MSGHFGTSAEQFAEVSWVQCVCTPSDNKSRGLSRVCLYVLCLLTIIPHPNPIFQLGSRDKRDKHAKKLLLEGQHPPTNPTSRLAEFRKLIFSKTYSCHQSLALVVLVKSVKLWCHGNQLRLGLGLVLRLVWWQYISYIYIR